MGIMIQLGLDTVSFYHPLSPEQKDKIMQKISVLPEFKKRKEAGSRKYYSDYFAAQGVKFRIFGIKLYIPSAEGGIEMTAWGLYVIVHPTLVLGDSDRSTLYQATKASYNKIVKTVDKMLKPVKIPCSLDKMLIYRLDVTANLICGNEKWVDEYIRILKKSMILPHYRLDWFRKDEEKAKDCKLANHHSHKQYCKSGAFFVYDKTSQLEMIDHFPDALIGKKLLRLEAQLRRKALTKWLPNKKLGSNWEIIRNVYKSRKRIINWYLKRTQPVGKYVRYEDAVDLIECAKLKGKTRKRMLYLLRKTSDKKSLTTALEDLKDTYHLNRGQCRTVLKKFEKLGISPITLANSSDLDELSPLRI